MVKEVIWSSLAIESFENIITYLKNTFGERAAQNFTQIVFKKIEMIKFRPKMFRPTGKRRNAYITSLNKKTTLTYRYKPQANKIELVVFWGMQDPERKP